MFGRGTSDIDFFERSKVGLEHKKMDSKKKVQRPPILFPSYFICKYEEKFVFFGEKLISGFFTFYKFFELAENGG